MFPECAATLVLKSAVSQKTGNEYQFVAVMVEGEEVGRLFLRPLELRVLFGGR